MMSRTSRYLLLAAALGSAACSEDYGDAVATTTAPPTELDSIGLAARPASLLVLDGADVATRRRVERTLEQLGGAAIESLPPRLMIAQVPDGAGPALARLGVTGRFDRALSDGEIAGATDAENRFAAVYSNRWHANVPFAEAIVARRAILEPGQAFEAPAEFRGPAPDPDAPQPGPAPDPEDFVSVPYASGTVVVSIILPESNGVIDPSTEDWTEERIREVYLKVQAGLDRIASAEPGAKLRYVLHYESAPANGGLTGTVDTDYEFVPRAQWDDTNDEWPATADVMSSVLGRTVTADELWTAAVDYQRGLRQQYNADAAFFVVVGANHNFSGGLRAHAFINGPWTTLESNNSADVFMHEFGHIFGAYDEYCPDACNPPTTLHGYLGIYNANAEFREGTEPGGGINDGRGEGASSLMQYNQMGAVNGYTRAAWGWLDADGDGIVDVRDTFPSSVLIPSVTGKIVRLTGLVTDRPQTSLWRTPYSVNRIVGLEIELVRSNVLIDVIDIDLPGDVRGRQPVDVTLPPLTVGPWTLNVRARNEVGNLEPVAIAVPVTIASTGNTPPIAHIDLPELRALSSGASYSVHADATDLEGGTARVRIDLGGDGSFETGWAVSHDRSFTPPAGVFAIVVEARDAAGLTSRRRVERLVFDGNAPPEVTLSGLPSIVHGSALATLSLTADAVDADGTTPDLSWVAQLATDDGKFDVNSGSGAGSTMDFTLPTPEKLRTTRVNLTAGDASLSHGQVKDLLVLDPTTIAVAGGTDGVWFVSIADVTGPRLIGKVALETVANNLFRRGNKLYVLGTMLTVIDISNLSAPVEIKQLTTTFDRREAIATDVFPLQEGDWGTSHNLYIQDGERINNARVVVNVNHPSTRQLKIVLRAPKQSGLAPIVLRDHVNGGNGNRTYTFTSNNTPALRTLHGQFAAEYWTLEVVDDVLDGSVGELISSELRLDTRSRAAKVIVGATQIVGRVSSGHLIVAGGGVEALDVSLPFYIHQVGKVRGTGTYDAVMVGDRVVLAMPMESKLVVNPVLKGFSVVDFSWAFFPQIVRIEDELGVFPDQLAQVGTRLYAHMVPWCPEPAEGQAPAPGCERGDAYTSVINPTRFASGGNGWELGRTTLRVDHDAFGNNQALWTVGDYGYVTRYDVSDVNAIKTTASYPQSWAGALYKLGNNGDVLLFQYGVEVQVGNLNAVISTLSRTYHLAVEARDDDGAVSRAYRTVHVVPYDHAPEITAVEHVAGVAGGDVFTFRVGATDVDAAYIWDPTLVVRADLDGDGTFDTDWAFLVSGSTVELSGGYKAPGTYQAVFEVRDGFWATDRHSQTVVVQ